jgi:3'(2'), 5'-bisphosphate nucleotidase
MIRASIRFAIKFRVYSGHSMIEKVKAIAKNAGQLIKTRYFRKGAEVRLKADLSPLTAADMASHEYLVKALEQLAPFPVISEEAESLANVPPNTTFWLIDPLDGSKGFIEGSGDFCVNIALIQDHEPVLGVIYVPVADELYFAEKGKGAGLERGRLKLILPDQIPTDLIIVRSRHHDHSLVDEFARRNGVAQNLTIGAALKFGNLARGSATLYPRYSGSREWDIAAGHILVTESGGAIIDLKTGRPPVYNKPDFRNGAFFATAKGFPISRFQLPS